MDKKIDYAQLAMLGIAVVAAVLIARAPGDQVTKLKLAIGYFLLILVFTFGMALVVLIVRGKLDLSQLLEELDGGASMSRFQLLIFTFVIALGFFYLTVSNNTGAFPSVPSDVLTLLGISASTYAISKGMQITKESGADETTAEAKAKQAAGAAAGGDQSADKAKAATPNP